MFRLLRVLTVAALAAGCSGEPVSSSASVTQQLTAGATTPIGGPVVPQPTVFRFASVQQQTSGVWSVSSSGSTTLAVFANAMTNRGQLSSRVRGVRLNAMGSILDPSGFDIGPLAENDQAAPDVAFNGTDFAVVWRVPGRFLFNFVTPGGVVRLPTPTEVASGVTELPKLACLATECLVVWTQANDISGARVDAAGALIGAPFSIATGVPQQTDPRVTVSGSSFFVAWRQPAIVGALVTANTVSSTVTVTSSTEYDIAGTSTVLAVWNEAGNIRGARISSSGVLLDPGGFSICSAAGTQSLPRVSWTGTQWVVTWTDERNAVTTGRDLYGARVSTAGVVLDTNGTALLADVAEDEVPMTSWPSSSSGVLVYQRRDTVPGQATLRSATLNAGTSLGPVFRNTDLVSHANEQTSPALAWNGNAYLAVWRDERDGGAILGARFFSDGGPLDTLPIGFASGSPFLSSPRVVTVSGSFLVTWSEGGRVRSAVLGNTGAPVANASSLSSSIGTYDIASNGSVVMMVYRDSANVVRASYLVGGTPFDVAASFASELVVTPGPGTQFTAAWRSPSGLWLARISGLSGDAGVLTTDPRDSAPRVSVIGNSTLVTWSEFSSRIMEGVLLSPNGTSAVVLTGDDAGTADSDLVSDGTQWVLLARGAVRRIDLLGVERDPSPAVVQPSGPNVWLEPSGKLVCPAPRQCQLVGSAFDPAPGLFAYRLSARPLLLTDRPLANAQNVTVVEDRPQPITLTGSDPDGDALTFSVISAPSRGTLSGTPPALTYTPAPNATGNDAFTFVASDGLLQSTIATISISITPVNDAPIAISQVLLVDGGMPVPFVLTANDIDGDPLTFTVVAGPNAGTLSGTPPNLTWRPAPSFGASDVLSFSVSDGVLSSTGTVTFQRVGGGPGGGSAGGGSAGGGSAGGGSAGGGSAGGGSAGGGSAGGGSAGGGSAGGGSAGGGSAGGGSAGGGSAGGGSAGGGSAGGGSAGGGSAGGESAGGAAGGESAGGAAGGESAGGAAGGGLSSGFAGGTSAAAGGSGGGSPTGPSGCGCSTGGQPMWLVVVALLVLRRRAL